MAQDSDTAELIITEGTVSSQLFEVNSVPEPLVLSVKRGPQGERRFYLNGIELRYMLPEWSLNGIGSRRVHFNCTLEVELDLPDDDPQGS